MCKGCKHLSKCLEAVVPAEVIFRALEEYEMFCPAEYQELWETMKQEKGAEA